MNHPVSVIGQPHNRTVAAPARPSDALQVRTIWLAVAVIVAGTWTLGRSGLYTPGSDFGYYLGLAGALMMLALMLYSVRKRVRWLSALGAMRHWFRLHMFLGIAGPTLILLHSTYHLGSLNASVAFYSMLVVAGSGVVGRFIYGKIHHGLYGREASVRELQTRLGLREGEVKSRFHFAPRLERRLQVFEAAATANRELLFGAWRFFTLAMRGRWVFWRCRRELLRALVHRAQRRQWPPGKLEARRRAGLVLIRDYLRAVVDAAQFSTYERLFSWWHVLHIPLVYLLVVSAIVHVIAVHMY